MLRNIRLPIDGRIAYISQLMSGRYGEIEWPRFQRNHAFAQTSFEYTCFFSCQT
jgi:hypothetical protein